MPPSANEDVIPAGANEEIVAAPTDENVRNVITSDPVRPTRAEHIFEFVDNIAKGIARIPLVVGQFHDDRSDRVSVGELVTAVAAGEPIRAPSTFDGVVSAPSGDRVVAPKAEKHICSIVADDRISGVAAREIHHLRSNGCECLDLGGRQQDVAHAGTDGVVTLPGGFDDYMAGIIDKEGVVPATAV